MPALTAMAWLRYDHIRRQLRRCPHPCSVLEVGAGQGAMAARLARRNHYLGVEKDETCVAAARRRLAAAPQGEIILGDEEAAADRAPFDVVCAFEVLEHLADDEAALKRWRDLLRPGGLVLLSVPAHQHRFGPWDRLVGHYRRYDARDLGALLADAGFVDVDVAMYGFPLGYLLEAIRDTVARRRRVADTPEVATASSGRLLQPPGWFAAVLAVAMVPFRLLQQPFRRSRLGIGLVAAARRAN